MISVNNKGRSENRIFVYMYDTLEIFRQALDDNQKDELLGCFQLYKGQGKYVGAICLCKELLTLEDIVHEVHHAVTHIYKKLGKTVSYKNEEDLAEINSQLVQMIYDDWKDYIHPRNYQLEKLGLDEHGCKKNDLSKNN
jgi:hypothetical protein